MAKITNTNQYQKPADQDKQTQEFSYMRFFIYMCGLHKVRIKSYAWLFWFLRSIKSVKSWTGNFDFLLAVVETIWVSNTRQGNIFSWNNFWNFLSILVDSVRRHTDQFIIQTNWLKIQASLIFITIPECKNYFRRLPFSGNNCLIISSYSENSKNDHIGKSRQANNLRFSLWWKNLRMLILMILCKKTIFLKFLWIFLKIFKLRDFQMTVRDLLVGIKRNFRKFYKNNS